MASSLDFLESIVTPDVLRELRRAENARASRQAAGMPAAARAGFGVGRAGFKLLSNVLPGGRARQDREEAEANKRALDNSADFMESVDPEVFSGPEGGLHRELIQFNKLAEELYAAGNSEDALRARTAANQVQMQLSEAQQQRKDRELTIQGRELNLEISRMRKQAMETSNFLDSRGYVIDTDKSPGDAFVTSFDTLSPADQYRVSAMQQERPSLMVINRDQAFEFFNEQAVEEDENLLTRSGFEEARGAMEASTLFTRTANRMLGNLLESETNPMTDIAGAERFGNRLLNDIDALKQWSREGELANQVGEYGEVVRPEEVQTEFRDWLQRRGVERQMNNTLLIQLAYAHSRRFNQRITDKDFEWSYRALGGDSGDPRLAVAAWRELIGLDIAHGRDMFKSRAETLTGSQSRAWNADYQIWIEQADSFESLLDQAEKRWGITSSDRVPRNQEQRTISSTSESRFEPAGDL